MSILFSLCARETKRLSACQVCRMSLIKSIWLPWLTSVDCSCLCFFDNGFFFYHGNTLPGRPKYLIEISFADWKNCLMSECLPGCLRLWCVQGGGGATAAAARRLSDAGACRAAVLGFDINFSSGRWPLDVKTAGGVTQTCFNDKSNFRRCTAASATATFHHVYVWFTEFSCWALRSS